MWQSVIACEENADNITARLSESVNPVAVFYTLRYDQQNLEQDSMLRELHDLKRLDRDYHTSARLLEESKVRIKERIWVLTGMT